MSNSETYRQILHRFTNTDDIRPYINAPVFASSKSVATDGHALVATPIAGEFEDYTEKVRAIYPIEHNTSKPISRQELRDAYERMKTEDCYDHEENVCEACDGEGEVDYEFEHGRRTYTKEHTCPICDGDGFVGKRSESPNGKKRWGERSVMQVGSSKFKHDVIEKLLFVADTLGSDITLVYQEHHLRASLFQVADVDVLLMPAHSDTLVVMEVIA